MEGGAKWKVVTLWYLSVLSVLAFSVERRGPTDYMTSNLRTFISIICPGQSGQLQCPANSVIAILSTKQQSIHSKGVACSIDQTVRRGAKKTPTSKSCNLEAISRMTHRMCNDKESCRLSKEQLKDKTTQCDSKLFALKIRYICTPSFVKQQLICADSYLEVDCSTYRSEKVFILEAKLSTASQGEGYTCPNLRQPSAWKRGMSNCYENFVTQQIGKDCNQKLSCSASPIPPPPEIKSKGCTKMNMQLTYACVNSILFRSKKSQKPRRKKKTTISSTLKPVTIPNESNSMERDQPSNADDIFQSSNPKKKQDGSKIKVLHIALAGVAAVVFIVVISLLTYLITKLVRRKRGRKHTLGQRLPQLHPPCSPSTTLEPPSSNQGSYLSPPYDRPPFIPYGIDLPPAVLHDSLHRQEVCKPLCQGRLTPDRLSESNVIHCCHGYPSPPHHLDNQRAMGQSSPPPSCTASFHQECCKNTEQHALLCPPMSPWNHGGRDPWHYL